MMRACSATIFPRVTPAWKAASRRSGRTATAQSSAGRGNGRCCRGSGGTVAAAADAIVTNPFGASGGWLARYDGGPMVARTNRRAVEGARRSAGESRFLIGSIGPSADVEPDAYAEQVVALVEAGVHAILF